MRNFDEDTITQAVFERVREARDPRTRAISEAVVRHLHALVREVQPTQAEWMAAVEFLTHTGQKCSDTRQEALLQTSLEHGVMARVEKGGAVSDFKGRHFAGEIVLWAVRWYCRYGVSYRDLEQMLGERGVSVDHSTIAGFRNMRRRSRGACGGSGVGRDRRVGGSMRPTSKSAVSGPIFIERSTSSATRPTSISRRRATPLRPSASSARRWLA